MLYAETESANPEQLENFDGIEQAVRSHLLEHVGPEIGEFSAKQQPTVVEPGGAVQLRASSTTPKSAQAKRKR